jgi:hypothetical protein
MIEPVAYEDCDRAPLQMYQPATYIQIHTGTKAAYASGTPILAHSTVQITNLLEKPQATRDCTCGRQAHPLARR